MSSNKKRTIADSLKPTYENVTREFITKTLDKVLFSSDELPNFGFEFRESEALDFIEQTLLDYRSRYKDDASFFAELEEKHQQILRKLKEKSNNNINQPIMVVNDYKKFFELLRQFYERDIELYFLRTDMSGFPVYEKNNCFEQIWLRATPDDFNNPEEFLRKQVEMINDRTFEKYDKETCLGKMGFLDDNIICVKNGIARTWDENSREFVINIYDKKYYNTKLYNRPHFMLPVIRYGIYEKDGKKVCYIGSIQNKSISLADAESNKKEEINKKVRRNSYKVNKDVSEEYKENVDPKSILALSLFINVLNQEGITDIEIPCMYVLDYEYHEKRSKKLIKDFKKEWTGDRKKQLPSIYKEEKNYLNHNYNKQDLISEIKTEGMIRKFQRILYHYSNGTIESYPGDVDSSFHINIPIVKGEDEIKGNVLKELYRLVNQRSQEERE